MSTEAKNKEMQYLYSAIHRVMEKIASVPKVDAAGIPYSFVSKDIVIQTIRPAMIEEGLIVFPIGVGEEVETIETPNGKIAYKSTGTVVFRLVHKSHASAYIDVPIPSMAIDYSDKSTNKFLGYAIKNFFLQTFVLQSGEPDPEGNGIVAGRTVSGSASASPSGSPRTARRTIPEDSRRISWSEDQIAATIESGAAENPPHAITLLNRPDVIVPKDSPPEWVGTWGTFYVAARYDDAGKKVGEVEAAVINANANYQEYTDKDLFPDDKKTDAKPEDPDDDMPF